MRANEIIKRIRVSAELAAVLEVSGWPKPGNVHRTMDHSDARYEHFLVGSIVLGSSIEKAALKGFMVTKRNIELSKLEVGKLVERAVSDISEAHLGGNTHLGVCLLFIPLATAAAKTYVERDMVSPDFLRDNVKEIMASTTPEDAVNVYEAITLVSSPHELGRISDVQAPDLLDKRAKRKILANGVSLFAVMKEASSYDSIASELVTGMEISFQIGYKELMETFNLTRDINVATVHTFLRILSKIPDTFIARKVGIKQTNNIKKAVELGRKETAWISKMAEQVLRIGGLTTKKGKAALWDFDGKLQNLGKDYSPGTTADLTAAALMIALLCGLKF
ncbi:MAG: triphosphoribosyl-dephospho-CoA synthase [Candidatus Bathyarchaeia archaeon]